MKEPLTRTERKYLELLLAKPEPVPVSKFLKLHKYNHSGANLVARHVSYLRRKLADEYVIETVYAFGYQAFPKSTV